MPAALANSLTAQQLQAMHKQGERGFLISVWVASAHQSVSLLVCVVSVPQSGPLNTCPWLLSCGGVWSTCAHGAATNRVLRLGFCMEVG